MKRQISVILAALLATSALARADQGAFTNGVPLASTIDGTELLPADKSGGSEAITPAQIASLAALGQLDKGNWLIGGDATTNLWQRGTTGASVTTTLTYGGPDRWAYWSGTNTAMTVSRVAGILSGQFAFKMAKTSGQTGLVPVCMEQVLESANSVQLEGQTVELDFDATTGANFSAASANMTAYIISGTGSNEGAAAMAKGLNGGGGGGAGWAGQVNATAAVISLGGVNISGRYAAVATIPNNVQEIGVALCYVPVGTAGVNDFISFSHVQLLKNGALASKVSTTLGYSCAALSCSPLLGRFALIEALLQWRYYWELDESVAITPVATCRSHSIIVAECLVVFPVPMRKVPTMSYVAGFAVETTAAGGTLGACTGLAAAATVAASGPSPYGAEVGCTATTVPAAGVALPLWNNNGAGKIVANAEL